MIRELFCFFPDKERKIPEILKIAEKFPLRKSLVSDIQNYRQGTGIFHNFV